MVELKEDFRTRLENTLTEKEIKPSELAKRTGISEATISQYRSGYSKPKKDRLENIANALGVDPAWLMGFDVPAERTRINGETLSASERELVRLFRNLSNMGQETALDLIRTLQATHPKEKTSSRVG